MTDIWVGNCKYCDVVYHEFGNNILLMYTEDGTLIMVSREDFIFKEDR